MLEQRGEYNCVGLFRVRNKDTPGNQIEFVDENERIICNSIFTFKEVDPTEKRMADFFKKRVICKKKV